MGSKITRGVEGKGGIVGGGGQLKPNLLASIGICVCGVVSLIQLESGYTSLGKRVLS